MNRPPLLDEAQFNPDQKNVYERIAASPRKRVEGPLRVWLQSPELADRAQALGAFCRYETSLPPRLSELAILAVGAYWQSGFEFAVHTQEAIKAGLSSDVIEAIRQGRRPDFSQEDEFAVHAFSIELLEANSVSEDVFAAAQRILGTVGLVELVGILGYYGLICMTINAFHVPLPNGADEPFPPFP